MATSSRGAALGELDAATALGVPLPGIRGNEAMTLPPGIPVLTSSQGVGEALGFASFDASPPLIRINMP